MASDSRSKNRPSERRPEVFFIGRFDENYAFVHHWFERYFDQQEVYMINKEPISITKLDVTSLPTLTEAINESINQACMILVDLTPGITSDDRLIWNPNVTYELGRVDQAGVPVFRFCQNQFKKRAFELPFDIRTCPVTWYEATPNGLNALCQAFKQWYERQNIISYYNAWGFFSQARGIRETVLGWPGTGYSQFQVVLSEFMRVIERNVDNMTLHIKSKTEFKLELPNPTKMVDVLFSETIKTMNGSSLFSVGDFKNPDSLAVKLRVASDPFSKYLREQFSEETRQQLDGYDVSSSPPDSLQRVLVNELNHLLQGNSLYNKQRFEEVTLTEKTLSLIDQNPQGGELIHLNRVLLEEVYPHEIAKSSMNADDSYSTISCAAFLSNLGIHNLGIHSEFQEELLRATKERHVSVQRLVLISEDEELNKDELAILHEHQDLADTNAGYKLKFLLCKGKPYEDNRHAGICQWGGNSGAGGENIVLIPQYEMRENRVTLVGIAYDSRAANYLAHFARSWADPTSGRLEYCLKMRDDKLKMREDKSQGA